MIALRYPPRPDRFISAKGAFMLYLMMKQHMAGKYDIIKYSWNMKVTDAAFNKRRDKYFFDKMSDKFHLKDLTEIFLATFLENSNGWAGDLVSEDAMAAHRELLGRYIRFSEIYREDLKNLVYFSNKVNVPIGKLLEYNEKQQTSPIFKLLQSGLIKTETFLVIDSFLGIIDKIDEKMSADIIWQNWHTKLVNYRKLVVINNDIAKAKFIQHVKEFKAEV
ncbi:DNA helicase loader [Aeromonas phage AS-gz]|uniref:DNA helicase loader n=2 Tax=Tulanevirus asgz TaxID=2560284 RepID=A0A898K8M6_9CAUD|nr:DNA helicase loader [Aeromonas phage AS-gz]ASU00603.1 DNA helicase loader [Aeromonas phage AS-gz]QSJ03600.1 DNA helicase loader [Aeromonas phage vB_AsM_ZHF]UIW12985.1 DNA helicase loader [Aeromonas phage AhMtk13a]